MSKARKQQVYSQSTLPYNNKSDAVGLDERGKVTHVWVPRALMHSSPQGQYINNAQTHFQRIALELRR